MRTHVHKTAQLGELVVAGSTVVQAPPLRDAAPADLAPDLGRLAKAIRELQELGNSLRMVPVRGTFQRMARMARDLARSLGKPIHFITSGEETELDKAMVDRVADPLIHMVRNAIDHGLEASAEDRRRAGKPEAGSVRLGAFHRGGRVHIEIEDDGRGIDLEGVAAKARENGLLPPGKALDERALLALIFAPGFSTAREVTAVSGRGVGLDVVKRNVESLRGQVEVRSRPGKGTVFTLKLPLTLAIIDGLVVSVGTRRFVIPTLSVVRSICPGKGDLSTALGRGEMVDLQDSTVALLRPAGLLGVRGASEDPTRGVVVLVAEGRRRAGLLVDSLAGREQIVIKSLGEDLDRIPGISGGALLPGGQLGLVLDVGGLLDLAEKCGDGVPQEVTAGETRGREVHQPIH